MYAELLHVQLQFTVNTFFLNLNKYMMFYYWYI